MQEGADPQELSYGDLIRDAFRIGWRNRFLWFFGFFVAGGGGLSSTLNNLTNLAPKNLSGGPPGSVSSFVQNNLVGLVIALALVAVLVAVVFVVLAIVSSGGLVSSVAAIDGGEERRFGSTWRAGLSVFWRVLLLGILLTLISLALALAILLLCGVPILLTFLLTHSTPARVILTILFALLGVVLFVAVFVPFGVIGQFALREMVMREGPVAGSISSAFRMFRGSPGKSLLVWLLNLGLRIGVWVATLILYLILGAVLLGPAIALYAAGYTTAAIALGVAGGLLFLVVVVLVSGAVGTFFHAYWTLAYLRLKRATPARPGP